MVNNDVLKKMRFILNFGDDQMISTFAEGGMQVSRSLVSQWLKDEENEDYLLCKDVELATFLNGLIVKKRGVSESGVPKAEIKLTNNLTLRKLKIAFDLKSEDLIEILNLADLRVGKHELSAFFRKPGHKNYRECKDQILRNFLMGLQLKERPRE